MPETITTCKVSETADVVEHIARRWQGSLIDLSVRPQANGLCVIRLTVPTGVDEPADPGPAPALLRALDAESARDAVRGQLDAVIADRDAHKANAEDLQGQLDEALAVLRELKLEVGS